MYTIKCPFCPDYYNSSKSHKCVSQIDDPDRARVRAELYGEEAPELETSAKPSRYNSGSLEVWDAIAQLKFNYMQGNVVKYISRYKDKNGPEDLVKAINYIIKMIAQETGEDYYELHKLTPEELAKRIKK